MVARRVWRQPRQPLKFPDAVEMRLVHRSFLYLEFDDDLLPSLLAQLSPSVLRSAPARALKPQSSLLTQAMLVSRTRRLLLRGVEICKRP